MRIDIYNTDGSTDPGPNRPGEQKYRTDPWVIVIVVIFGLFLGFLGGVITKGQQAKIVHVGGSQLSIKIDGPVSTVVFDKDSFANLVITGENEIQQRTVGQQQ